MTQLRIGSTLLQGVPKEAGHQEEWRQAFHWHEVHAEMELNPWEPHGQSDSDQVYHMPYVYNKKVRKAKEARSSSSHRWKLSFGARGFFFLEGLSLLLA